MCKEWRPKRRGSMLYQLPKFSEDNTSDEHKYMKVYRTETQR